MKYAKLIWGDIKSEINSDFQPLLNCRNYVLKKQSEPKCYAQQKPPLKPLTGFCITKAKLFFPLTIFLLNQTSNREFPWEELKNT